MVEGCVAQAPRRCPVHSAPAPVNVMFSELDSAICSGGSITLTMDEPVLDASSTLDDFDYTWTAMGSNNEVYTVTSFRRWSTKHRPLPRHEPRMVCRF